MFDHHDEIEADLARYYPRDGDQMPAFWAGDLSPRRLLVLLQRIPQDGMSQLAWAILGEAAAWTLGDRLMAHAANLLNNANHQRAGKRMGRADLIQPPDPKTDGPVPPKRQRPRPSVPSPDPLPPKEETVGTWKDLDKLFTGEA